MQKVIIYILSNNIQRFNISQRIFRQYSWAKPIILKNPDFSFENVFWTQLNDLYEEWKNADMVGTLSYSAFKKINLNEVDEIIRNNLYYPNKYYHFMDSNVPIPNDNTNKHPNFMVIWNDILDKLKLNTTTENNCNYWMCSPALMKPFINWYMTKCLPILKNHPLIFTNANYTSEDYNNQILKSELVKIWGNSYYPHFPFVAERLNKCFFETYYPKHVEKPNNFCWKYYTTTYSDLRSLNKLQAKDHFYKYGQFENRLCNVNNDDIKNNLIRHNNLLPRLVFLISHDKNVGGAEHCLFNVENIYKDKGIKTEMLYLNDIKFNIVEYILNRSVMEKCYPVVICNTLVCYNIVKTLSRTNILTYRYIHEWYDKFMQKNIGFKNCMTDHELFNSSINLIFVCKSSVMNYKNYIPIINNYTIAYNSLSPKMLDNKLRETQNKIIKNNDNIYLSIIGTVETRKQQQIFIDNVFYKLKRKYSHIKLVLVGRIFEPLIIDPLYAKDIIIIGVVDNALPYINLSDIIISYSINEVLPLNIIESFYCKKAVIATNVGGIHEMIQDNYNGFLIERGEHGKCFTTLCNLIENKSVRDTIANRAKETFFKKFDIKRNVKKFMSLLNCK